MNFNSFYLVILYPWCTSLTPGPRGQSYSCNTEMKEEVHCIVVMRINRRIWESMDKIMENALTNQSILGDQSSTVSTDISKLSHFLIEKSPGSLILLGVGVLLTPLLAPG